MLLMDLLGWHDWASSCVMVIVLTCARLSCMHAALALSLKKVFAWLAILVHDAYDFSSLCKRSQGAARDRQHI